MEGYRAPYTAMDVAKHIIYLCASTGRPVSNLKLQKMLYFVQGEYMKSKNGLPLFADDFEAWPYGPVVHEVYDNYKLYGSSDIYEGIDQDKVKDTGVCDIIDPVISRTRGMTAGELVNQTHQPNGAWAQMYNGLFNQVIPKKLIYQEFAGK